MILPNLTKFKQKTLTVLLLIFTQCAYSQVIQMDVNIPTDGYKAGYFIEGKDTLRFRYFVPQHKGYQRLGILLFLHGAGERGTDNQSQLSHGSDFLKVSAQNDSFPYIVIFPQCPKNSYWSNVKRTEDEQGKPHFKFNHKRKSTKAMKQLVHFTDWLIASNIFDNQHFVVGGLSMGGMGTIELVRRRPEVFCAAFPICGGGIIKHPETLQNTRFWFFHGAKDDIVPPENSDKLVDELKKADLNVRYNLYPEANHNSWDSAFSEPGLAAWLNASMPEQIIDVLINTNQ